MSIKNNFTMWQSLIIISGLLLSGICGWMLYQSEVRDANNALIIDVEHRAEALTRQLLTSVEPLYAVSALVENDQPPSDHQFNKFTTRILAHHQSIQAIEWIPKVTVSEREQFELSMKASLPHFEITEQGDNRVMIRATDRAEYFPVHYVAPMRGNEKAIGFDQASNPTRLASLLTARDSASQVATASIKLVQETGDSKGLLVFLPIYKAGTNLNHQDKSDLKNQLLGFIAGAYRVNELFYKSESTGISDGLELSLFDNTNGQTAELLLRHTAIGDVLVDESNVYQANLPLFHSRQWSLVGRPTPEYLSRYHSYMPLGITCLGSLLTLLFIVYLRMIQNEAVQVQKLVDDKTRELSLLNQKLKHISSTDVLTDIANRRSMDLFLEKEWARAMRQQTAISVIMLDIDNFKQYNDVYGRISGDECLKSIAQMLVKMIGRPGDMVARYGGEEFCLIIANNNDVSSIAHKCQTSVERLQIPHQTSDFVTASVGYCTVTPQLDMLAQDALKAAEKALELAKENGKNRVEKALFESTQHVSQTVII